MAYQVLARKYRPANFEELEGQEHVLRALVNSLDQNRLHHAYLFAGTRGVGKTTIARILAKCLNCEKGITSKPCGECSACVEISQGRAVDLIEVDAASRTRVEDTRELLENVQYMPTHSRFKVYLIDEVHMLSNHSFNALLKTLEEPPEHVKFLLATTDPKKLPITVLSRCLQFNLKNLSPERIVHYLKQVLERENIGYEEPALWQLGRAADGSMRDALSLTDQAISFGDNTLTERDVSAMLGTIDHREVYEMLDALIARDAAKLMARIAALAEFGPDYEMLLAEFLRVLHRVALTQAVPEGVDNSHGDRELVVAVSKSLSREDVQLYYQIGLMGQRDLPLAPDPRDGFEMVMLRMLAFAPDTLVEGQGSDGGGNPPGGGGGGRPKPEDDKPAIDRSDSPVADILARINAGESARHKEVTPRKEAKAAESRSAAKPAATRPAPKPAPDQPAPKTAAPAVDDGSEDIPWGDTSDIKASSTTVESAPADNSSDRDADKRVEAEPVASAEAPAKDAGSVDTPVAEPKPEPVRATRSLAAEDWVSVLPELGLTGVTGTLASNCIIGRIDASECVLVLNEHHASLWNKTHETRIGKALGKWLGHPITLSIEIGTIDRETPAQVRERVAEERRAHAINAIENDDKVRQLIDTFDGKINVESIMPRSQAGE